jgi:hypothetical protein
MKNFFEKNKLPVIVITSPDRQFLPFVPVLARYCSAFSLSPKVSNLKKSA